MTVVEKIYEALRQAELTDSQYDFSANWCGMSRSYLSWLKAAKAHPSIEVLSKLLFRVQAEEQRLMEMGESLFPEVHAHDAKQLQEIKRALQSELERVCLL